MEKIKRLLKALSPSEVRLLKQYLTAFHQKRKNKSLQLVELLEKQPQLSEDSLLHSLYGKPNRKAFQMLKSRTIDKILQVIILTSSLQGGDSSNEELLIYAALLKQRNLIRLAEEYLHKCLKKAEKEGLSELALLALMQMKSLPISSPHQFMVQKKFKRILAELQTDVIGREINDKWTKATTQTSFNQLKRKDIHLQKDLALMEDRLSKAYTPRSHYYYLQTRLLYFQQKMNYSNCMETVNELFDLISSHRLLSSRPFLFSTYIHTAHQALLFGDYELGKLAASYAMNIGAPSPKALFQAARYHIYADLYLGHIDSAQLEINKLKGSTFANSYRDIVNYLQACIYFHRCQFKKAFQEMLQIKGLGSHEYHTVASMRIFEFILLSENEEYDLFLMRLESFRKYIYRYPISIRHKLFFQYFNQLAKDLFFFDPGSSKLPKIMAEIQRSTKWNPTRYEAVKIDTWIKSKLRNQTYFTLFSQDTPLYSTKKLSIPEPKKFGL